MTKEDTEQIMTDDLIIDDDCNAFLNSPNYDTRRTIFLVIRESAGCRSSLISLLFEGFDLFLEVSGLLLEGFDPTSLCLDLGDCLRYGCEIPSA